MEHKFIDDTIESLIQDKQTTIANVMPLYLSILQIHLTNGPSKSSTRFLKMGTSYLREQITSLGELFGQLMPEAAQDKEDNHEPRILGSMPEWMHHR